MKNVLLGCLIAFAVGSMAAEWREDGSLVLSREEVDQVRLDYYQLNYNFRLAVERVGELTRELDALKSGKCI